MCKTRLIFEKDCITILHQFKAENVPQIQTEHLVLLLEMFRRHGCWKYNPLTTYHDQQYII